MSASFSCWVAAPAGGEEQQRVVLHDGNAVPQVGVRVCRVRGEVPGSFDRPPEVRAGPQLVGVLQPGAVGPVQPGRRAPEDDGAARVGQPGQVLAGDTDDRVVVAVVVQVAGGHGLPEAVAGLGTTRDARGVLVEDALLGSAETARRAVLHGDVAGARGAAHRGARGADQHVVETVAVVVAVVLLPADGRKGHCCLCGGGREHGAATEGEECRGRKGRASDVTHKNLLGLLGCLPRPAQRRWIVRGRGRRRHMADSPARRRSTERCGCPGAPDSAVAPAAERRGIMSGLPVGWCGEGNARMHSPGRHPKFTQGCTPRWMVFRCGAVSVRPASCDTRG